MKPVVVALIVGLTGCAAEGSGGGAVSGAGLTPLPSGLGCPTAEEWTPQSVIDLGGQVIVDLDISSERRELVVALRNEAALNVYDLSDPSSPTRSATDPTSLISGSLGPARVGFVGPSVAALIMQGEASSYTLAVFDQMASGGLVLSDSVAVPGGGYKVMTTDGARIAVSDKTDIWIYEYDGALSAGTKVVASLASPINRLTLDRGSLFISHQLRGISLVNLSDESVSYFPTVGQPEVPLRVGDGWLVGETSNSWMRPMAASMEFLENSNLVDLGPVPVRSGLDSQDGAFETAIYAGNVYVANAESGLMCAPWSKTPITLQPATLSWRNWSVPIRFYPTRVSASGNTSIVMSYSHPRWPTRVSAIEDILIVSDSHGIALVKIR